MKDLKSAIDHSPLRFKMRPMSLEIFEEWSSRAARKHHLPVTRIRDEVSEEELESDLVDHLTEGIGLLFEERYSHKPMSWRYGFLCGYVRAKLTTGWHKRYFSRNSRGYEELVKLAALREFLGGDPASVRTICAIYEGRLETEEGTDSERKDASDQMAPAPLPEGVLIFPTHRLPNHPPPEEGFARELRELLKDIIQEKLDLYLDEDYGSLMELCPPLDTHLPEDEVCALLQELDAQPDTS